MLKTYTNVLTILLTLLTPIARAATIETQDHHTHTGTLKIVEGQITLTKANNAPTILSLDQCRLITFDPPATKPSAPIWTSTDIGKAPAPGRFTLADGVMHLEDQAGGLLSREKGFDSFLFARQTIKGDLSFTARLQSMPDSRHASAGLMVRASLKPDSPTVYFAHSSSGSSTLFARNEPKEDMEDAASSDKTNPAPIYLRLERTGNTFTADESLDGQTWTHVATVEVSMPKTVHVGLASASGPTTKNNAPAHTTFDQISLNDQDDSDQSTRLPAGVITLTGSVIRGKITRVDENKIELKLPDGKSRSLDPRQISTIVINPLNPAQQKTLADARNSAVLLSNNDLMEAEIKSIEDQTVKINSVIFGPRALTLNRSVAAILLKPAQPNPTDTTALLTDGTRLKGQLTIRNDQLTLTDPLLGPTPLPLNQLQHLQLPSK